MGAVFFFPVFFFPYVKKIKKSVREKENSAREKQKVCVKIGNKKKVPVKQVKISKKCPWNQKSAREKSGKSVRESDFAIREKSWKKAKNGFHGHFWFSRKKMLIAKYHRIILGMSEAFWYVVVIPVFLKG